MPESLMVTAITIISDGREEIIMITYSAEKNYTEEQLAELFNSVDWLSGKYPKKLKKALDNCETVLTAWDGEKLVGLINTIDDGVLTAYVHYLCVNPAYQGTGIGKELLRQVKDKYKDYLYLLLVAENEPLIQYYTRHGFQCYNGRYVMMIQNDIEDK